MVWITTGKSLYVTQKQMTHKHVWHETVIHMWQTTAHDTQAFLTWNSCPCVANNRKWHTIMFGMKQLSTCGKQQQMTHKHFCLEAVVHMWQTTANDISMLDMKQLSICGKQQQMTYNHFWHETFVHMWQTTANDIQAFWHETVTIGGKQQQMTHKHVWHETVIHMWQTTANDTQTCLTWNSCPYVANNSKWHTSIFDMKQLSICGKQQQMTHSMFDMKQLSICGKQQDKQHAVIQCGQQQRHTIIFVWHETVIHMWQTTANDTQACFTWNSYPYMANNSKWHTNMFAMKQLSICGK